MFWTSRLTSSKFHDKEKLKGHAAGRPALPMTIMRRALTPEFLNRNDFVVLFDWISPLTTRSLRSMLLYTGGTPRSSKALFLVYN